MDWRELQERERFNQIRLLVREEIRTVLEDLSNEVLQSRTDLDISAETAQEIMRVIDIVQVKIKERGTDGTT